MTDTSGESVLARSVGCGRLAGFAAGVIPTHCGDALGPLCSRCKPAADLRQMTHERDLLATALGDLLVSIGGSTAGMPLTGPQLLMLAEDATLYHKAKADGMEQCEGCPAWLGDDDGHTDVEGVRLCDDCWTDLAPRSHDADRGGG